MATEVTTDQSEISDPSELYYLCEEPGGSLDGIHQWINNNKDNSNRLKAAATYQGEHDQTPLHIILKKYEGDTILDIIERFIESVPEAIQMKDSFGCLPIYSAVGTGTVSLKVLQALVNSYPASVKVTNRDGLLPLHFACINGQLEVINFLIKSYPESVKVTNRDGLLPLHFACINGQLEVINFLIKLYPESVKVADDDGHLPLHIACENASSKEILQALVNSYPASVRVIDSDGNLPLHSALAGLSVYLQEISLKECEALNFLIESYPESTDQENENGETPLDIYSSNFDIVTDKNGMLLLHHACINGNYLHLIHFLIQAHPESSSAPDNDGKTPLQYLKETASCKDERGMLLLHRKAAHYKGLSVEILPFLFDAYPEAIRVQDNAGLLPIHHACLNESSSLDIIMSLVKLYPESIVV